MLSKKTKERYNGKVPRTFEDLENLQGVGHKTASVIMSQKLEFQLFQLIHIFIDRSKMGINNWKNVIQTEKI